MNKYYLESICTFHEAFVIEAENEEDAKRIYFMHNPDQNYSKYLGDKIIAVYPETPEVYNRFMNTEEMFFDGYSKEEGNQLKYVWYNKEVENA